MTRATIISVGAFLLFLWVLAISAATEENPTKENDRTKKFLSMFAIVNFPNDACDGSSDNNGTCYTKEECSNKGGVETGSCASGYGVCCTFTLRCGDKSNENTTYFESNGLTSGSCGVKICKADPNICQIRLDFITFIIDGPATSTTTIGQELNGVDSSAGTAGKNYDARTQCQNDIFTVASPGNSAPPSICGLNTGEHMYVDASDDCIDLNFKLGQTTTSVTRAWNIRVTQFKCDYENLAPSGCTQYYFDPTGTGTVKSFNFGSGTNSFHLANQRQRICVRREKGFSRICWAHAMTDFQISGLATDGVTGMKSNCCGYGSKGDTESGYDCVVIPSANQMTANNAILKNDEFCGGKLALTGALATAVTVCSIRQPFFIQFNTDNFEQAVAKEVALASRGFRLAYKQS